MTEISAYHGQPLHTGSVLAGNVNVQMQYPLVILIRYWPDLPFYGLSKMIHKLIGPTYE